VGTLKDRRYEIEASCGVSRDNRSISEDERLDGLFDTPLDGAR